MTKLPDNTEPASSGVQPHRTDLSGAEALIAKLSKEQRWALMVALEEHQRTGADLRGLFLRHCLPG
jgi:hypothetical protein